MNTQGESDYELGGKDTGDESAYRASMDAKNSVHSAAKQSLLSKAEQETVPATTEGGH